jgi:hypothetical protein
MSRTQSGQFAERQVRVGQPAVESRRIAAYVRGHFAEVEAAHLRSLAAQVIAHPDVFIINREQRVLQRALDSTNRRVLVAPTPLVWRVRVRQKADATWGRMSFGHASHRADLT